MLCKYMLGVKWRGSVGTLAKGNTLREKTDRPTDFVDASGDVTYLQVGSTIAHKYLVVSPYVSAEVVVGISWMTVRSILGGGLDTIECYDHHF